MEIIPGEQIRLVLQLVDSQKDLRYIVENLAGIVSVSIPKLDGFLTKSMTAFSLDRSIWEATLTEAETADLIGGNIIFEVDSDGVGTEILKGWVENAISMVVTGGCS